MTDDVEPTPADAIPEQVRPRPANSGRSRTWRMHTGRVIPLEEALASGPDPRVVLLVGPVACGKTTLVAAVFETLSAGPMGTISFAGSKTLISFEERTHDGLITSGLEVPTTVRTSREHSDGLLELTVVPRAGAARQTIYLTDISGEIFEEIVDSPSSIREIKALGHATRIQVLLDGEQLGLTGERDLAVYRTECLLRSLVDYGDLMGDAMVDIVVTKLDIVERDGSVEFSRNALASLEAMIPHRHRGGSFQVCSRSADGGSVSTGTGLEEVVHQWTRSGLGAGGAD